MIGTSSTRLIDGSTFRLPRTGVFTNTGVNMEKQGVQPDVAVELTPEDWRKGIDTQLLKAVEVVATDVREWKVRKSSIAGGSSSPIPVASPTLPAPTPKTPATSPSPRTPPSPREAPNGLIPLAD